MDKFIADILADNREGSESTIDTLAEHFACALSYVIPNFDAAKFISTATDGNHLTGN